MCAPGKLPHLCLAWLEGTYVLCPGVARNLKLQGSMRHSGTSQVALVLPSVLLQAVCHLGLLPALSEGLCCRKA